jgi:hypothetical protein
VGPANDADVVHEIAIAVRRYVVSHPDAADSIDGIHHWWLPPSLHEEAPALVDAAVVRLVVEGVLRRVTQEDGRVIYSSALGRP